MLFSIAWEEGAHTPTCELQGTREASETEHKNLWALDFFLKVSVWEN